MVKHHLLVTNDFPPKVGGIQAYLWELWRRLDPSSFTVLTASSHPDHQAFDAEQAARGVRIVRVPEKLVFFPRRALAQRVRTLAEETGAGLVLLDPALPLGLLGPSLGLPFGVILHGAEITAPGRLPVAGSAMRRVLRRSSLIVAAGSYPLAEARRIAGGPLQRAVEVPPGVDCRRFVPLDGPARAAARRRWGLAAEGPRVVSLSRLVPRKGMDVAIDAVARLAPSFSGLTLAIGGRGRDEARLRARAAKLGAPVRFLGPVPDEELPSVMGMGDVFVMACRNRWLGLEQEGFGIVFVEAAAAGVPQIAGDSGGASEAVDDGVTGLVVSRPSDPGALAGALRRLLGDENRAQEMGQAARARAVASFDYDMLARRLAGALDEMEG
jgi:phosphatidylinositol alpha-1,6-mannosyltransferase